MNEKTQYCDIRKCSNEFCQIIFFGDDRNSTQENYSVENINIVLFLHDNICTNFNHIKENIGFENRHVVINDKFGY